MCCPVHLILYKAGTFIQDCFYSMRNICGEDLSVGLLVASTRWYDCYHEKEVFLPVLSRVRVEDWLITFVVSFKFDLIFSNSSQKYFC